MSPTESVLLITFLPILPCLLLTIPFAVLYYLIAKKKILAPETAASIPQTEHASSGRAYGEHSNVEKETASGCAPEEDRPDAEQPSPVISVQADMNNSTQSQRIPAQPAGQPATSPLRTRSGKTSLVILLVACVFLYGWTRSNFNSMVSLDEQVKTAWSRVETHYQRRADLIPHLVTLLASYAAHEQATLEQLLNARARAINAGIEGGDLTESGLRRFQAEQAELGHAISRLLILTESSPNLKSSEAFQKLQIQLEITENSIAAERIRFNEIARAYNIYIRSFPSNVLAALLNFEPRPYFSAGEGAEQTPAAEHEDRSAQPAPEPAQQKEEIYPAQPEQTEQQTSESTETPLPEKAVPGEEEIHPAQPEQTEQQTSESTEPLLPEKAVPVEEEKAKPDLNLPDSASYTYLLNPDKLLRYDEDFNKQAAKMENEVGVRVLAVLWRCDDSREYSLPPQELYSQFKIDDSAQGKNLLIFLAVDPQRYFLEIVPGPALKDVLTEPAISRLKGVFMLPFIEQHRYDACLEHALTELYRIFKDHFGVAEPPRDPSTKSNSSFPVAMLFFVGFIMMLCHINKAKGSAPMPERPCPCCKNVSLRMDSRHIVWRENKTLPGVAMEFWHCRNCGYHEKQERISPPQNKRDIPRWRLITYQFPGKSEVVYNLPTTAKERARL
ncbi:MAG: LemA family protein [Desulfovibrionaceae bacterium]|nr:LemA family protein [Desulfovibrionaceae bacterium]